MHKVKAAVYGMYFDGRVILYKMCVIFITKPIVSAKRLAYSTSTINGTHTHKWFISLAPIFHAGYCYCWLSWWCRCGIIFNRIKRCISRRNRRKTGRSNEQVCCDKGDSCLRNWKNIPSKQVNNVNTCIDSSRPRETKSLHGSLTKSYPCDAMCGLSIIYQFC